MSVTEMALLKFFIVAILFAGCQRVDAIQACQVCNNALVDRNLTVGTALTFDTFIENVNTELCADAATSITATAAHTVLASLQVLVTNPTYCYFTFYFGATASKAYCMVSGYNTPGSHYTSGSCEAIGALAANDALTVKIGNAQGTGLCTLRYSCLSAFNIPS